jgi:hypothetical protein
MFAAVDVRIAWTAGAGQMVEWYSNLMEAGLTVGRGVRGVRRCSNLRGIGTWVVGAQEVKIDAAVLREVAGRSKDLGGMRKLLVGKVVEAE